jgi:hypothetical protein
LVSNKYLNKYAAGLSIVTGFAGFLFFRWYSIGIPREIATLLFSLGGYIIGLLVTKEKIVKESL